MSTPDDVVRAYAELHREQQSKRLPMGTWESWLEGPKFIKPEIEKAIIDSRLERVYVREDRRWFRTTVYFKVRGPADRLQAFQAAFIVSRYTRNTTGRPRGVKTVTYS